MEMRRRCQLEEMAAITLIRRLSETQSPSSFSLSVSGNLFVVFQFLSLLFLREKRSDAWRQECFVTSGREQLTDYRLTSISSQQRDYYCCVYSRLCIIQWQTVFKSLETHSVTKGFLQDISWKKSWQVSFIHTHTHSSEATGRRPDRTKCLLSKFLQKHSSHWAFLHDATLHMFRLNFQFLVTALWRCSGYSWGEFWLPRSSMRSIAENVPAPKWNDPVFTPQHTDGNVSKCL